jgi:hypothetical protein
MEAYSVKWIEVEILPKTCKILHKKHKNNMIHYTLTALAGTVCSEIMLDK